MFQTIGISRALYDIRPFVLRGRKVLQDADPQDKGSERACVNTGGQTWPEQDESAIVRLLSRAELEMWDPEAVQRRDMIACLKLAAASIKA